MLSTRSFVPTSRNKTCYLGTTFTPGLGYHIPNAGMSIIAGRAASLLHDKTLEGLVLIKDSKCELINTKRKAALQFTREHMIKSGVQERRHKPFKMSKKKIARFRSFSTIC